jgi:3-mercaptopyruvate sulfurtransferase SseA
MNKYKIWILISLIATTLFGKEKIFISPKIALKMVDKSNVIFISLDESNIVIKRGKKFNHELLNSLEILGHLPCENLYLCPDKIEAYFSKIGIQTNNTLIIHDDSYGIYASTLYTVLESLGHTNISILRGNIKEILDLDPNWENYKKYVHQMRNLELLIKTDVNQTKQKAYIENLKSVQKKIELLKPHLLVELHDNTNQNDNNVTYKVKKIDRSYLQSKDEFYTTLQKRISHDNNATVIDVCGLGGVWFEKGNSLNSHFKSISWKSLIDKETRHLESNEALENFFNKLELNKEGDNYVYCMSAAPKAFFVMLAMREVGFKSVKSFIGDWNVWTGDLDE